MEEAVRTPGTKLCKDAYQLPEGVGSALQS